MSWGSLESGIHLSYTSYYCIAIYMILIRCTNRITAPAVTYLLSTWDTFLAVQQDLLSQIRTAGHWTQAPIETV